MDALGPYPSARGESAASPTKAQAAGKHPWDLPSCKKAFAAHHEPGCLSPNPKQPSVRGYLVWVPLAPPLPTRRLSQPYIIHGDAHKLLSLACKRLHNPATHTHGCVCAALSRALIPRSRESTAPGKPRPGTAISWGSLRSGGLGVGQEQAPDNAWAWQELAREVSVPCVPSVGWG